MVTLTKKTDYAALALAHLACSGRRSVSAGEADEITLERLTTAPKVRFGSSGARNRRGARVEVPGNR